MYEFEILRTSKLSQPSKSEMRTSIPLDIIEMLDLEKPILKHKLLISYKILKYPTILILTLRELSRDEIIKINQFFSTSEMVQRFEKLKVYVNRPKTHFAIKIEPMVIDFLNLEPDKIIGYAILEVGKTKEERYLLISSDLKIRLEDSV